MKIVFRMGYALRGIPHEALKGKRRGGDAIRQVLDFVLGGSQIELGYLAVHILNRFFQRGESPVELCFCVFDLRVQILDQIIQVLRHNARLRGGFIGKAAHGCGGLINPGEKI